MIETWNEGIDWMLQHAGDALVFALALLAALMLLWGYECLLDVKYEADEEAKRK